MEAHSAFSDLYGAGKLDGQNYAMWHRKIQFLLHEKNILDHLTTTMPMPIEPENGQTAQYRREMDAYNKWLNQDMSARYTMLSCMHDHLIREFEKYTTAKELWEILKVMYGTTSATRLRALTLKFNQYVLDPKHSMTQHLDVMKDMIRELQNAGTELTDEQQVLAVLRSLPEQTWGHVKLVLTHNEQIKTFDSVASHLKLEADRRESERAQTAAFVAHAGKRKPKGKRSNQQKNAGQSSDQNLAPKGEKAMKRRRGKRGGKKKDVCYNCQKPGHFARDCTEPKKVGPMPSSLNCLVCSHVFVANSLLGWIVDTGATKHVTRDRAGFVDYHRVSACSHYIAMGNGAQEEVVGVGSYQLKLSTGRELLLSDVQYAPSIRCNLLSVTALSRHGFSFLFEQSSLSIFYGKDLYGLGVLNNGFFMLELSSECVSYVSSTSDVISDSVKWHARLGHIGQERMARLAREGFLGQLAKVNLPICEPCLAGKACRKPFGKAQRATQLLELVHSDICGPMNVRARHGASYFLTFIDDYSRYGSVYLLSHRSEALDCFKRFLAEVENQRDRNLKVLRTDRGREYLSDQFRQFSEERGIIRQLSIPHTPQQNGVAERRNRTLLEMVRSMMAQANLPISFWGDAILTAAYVLNRVPSKSVPTTPYELWHGRKPNLEGLRPWGSAGFVHSTSHKHGKLGPRAVKHIFIRYCDHSKGYVMYGEHPDGGMTEIESRDVNFLEEDFPTIGEVKGDLKLYELQDSEVGAPILGEGEASQPYPVIDGDNESDPQYSGSVPLAQDSQTRRSKRGIVPRRRYEIEGESFMCASVDIDEPATYEEAVTSPNAEEWITAMKEEMSSMAKNHVWELVDLPPGRKTVGNKWVLKVKRKADGSIDKYKARLVAKGYTQREGIDYEETFSPVVRFASIRLILAIVAHLDLELFQMDVKTAFLNGELDDEIYMDQPKGFQEKGHERKVCRLKRSIYGLKQSSRQWYHRFHRAITSIGFTMIEEDHCVYVKRSGRNFLILSLYVDDILLAGNDMEMIVATQEWLSSTFEMKDMGEADYILGVKIHRDRSRKFLSLSQETYIKKILERFRMHNANPIDTPMDKNCVLSKESCPKTEEERERMAKVPYASAVGSLMYAMMCTRPDLCFAVGMVSRYQSNPGRDHWVAVKRILRYLKGTSGVALCYHGGSLKLTGYSDADGSADRDERKSTSGYVFLLGGAAITWCSKKQPCISLSTMEAEYVACTSAVQEAIWLRRFLQSLRITAHVDDAVTVYCDNTAALAYAKDPKYHGRTKHIDTRYHFIRDSIAQGQVVLRHVPTSDMVADPFTKPLRRDLFQRHVSSMGLRRI